MNDKTENGFHFYDVPQKFMVSFRVTGSSNIEVEASTSEDAIEKAEAIIFADDFEPELDDVDDVQIVYAAKSPTRFYLVNRPGTTVSAATRREPEDLPREPQQDDNWMLTREGYAPSWAIPSDPAP